MKTSKVIVLQRLTMKFNILLINEKKYLKIAYLCQNGDESRIKCWLLMKCRINKITVC